MHTVWQVVGTDNLDAPPRRLQQGFKGELYMLGEKKIDLFPWLIVSIRRADLEQNGLHDRLHVETDNGVEDINLVIHPDPLGLPVIIDVLRGIQRDTMEQVQLMQQLNRIPNGIDDALVKQAIKSYSVQRADLIGYHRILTVWRQSQPAPSVQRVINHWLGILDEIELNTKAVLGIVEDYDTDAGSVIRHRGSLKDAIVVRPSHYTALYVLDGRLFR